MIVLAYTFFFVVSEQWLSFDHEKSEVLNRHQGGSVVEGRSAGLRENFSSIYSCGTKWAHHESECSSGGLRTEHSNI